MWFTSTNRYSARFCFFFFNDTATTEIYTLSLHDALPISWETCWSEREHAQLRGEDPRVGHVVDVLREHLTQYVNDVARSEEHTSELQSQSNLVCRLLLEKKKDNIHELTRTALLSRTLKSR